MISFHCGTFQPKKFTSLLTSLSHSTLQISCLLDCEISSECTVFLDTEVLKAPRLSTHKIFDLQTHFKPTETFQYTHISSCHLSNCKKGKGGTLCLLRTNSLRGNFKQSKWDFAHRLCQRGYPLMLIKEILTVVKFTKRKGALHNKTKQKKEILPFCYYLQSGHIESQKILMKHLHIIKQQPTVSSNKSLTSHRLSPTGRKNLSKIPSILQQSQNQRSC